MSEFVIVAVVTLLTSSSAIIEAIYRKKKLHTVVSLLLIFCNKNQQAKLCLSYERVNVKNNSGSHALLKGIFIWF